MSREFWGPDEPTNHDELDNILADMWDNLGDKQTQIAISKAAILANYISKEEVEEALELEDGHTDPSTRYREEPTKEWYRNQLRSELRKKLGLKQ